jgi:hypothetical protein
MADVESYLARVGYKGPTSPTLETLRAIHYAHLLAVPFENLDIGLGGKIALDEDSGLKSLLAGPLRRGEATPFPSTTPRGHGHAASYASAIRIYFSAFTRAESLDL